MKCFVIISLFLMTQSARTSLAFSFYNQQSLGKAVTTSFVPRTCHEGFESGHPDMQASGMYWIDPDGLGIGEVPIYVHCERGTADETGIHHTTTLLHDKEATFGIQVCNDDVLCTESNDVPINYTNASKRQLWALAELSESCEQSIQIKLVRDTLERKISWWDRFDAEHFFWHGIQAMDGDTEKHQCQCGETIPSLCLDSFKPCNCDAAVAIPVSDQGIITDKDLLPVTKLHFGKIQYEGGELTLGRFHCKGKQGLGESNQDGQPQSCKDLWMLGYKLSGVYNVRYPGNPDTCKTTPLLAVYCDFLEPGDDLVGESVIGSFCLEQIPDPNPK